MKKILDAIHSFFAPKPEPDRQASIDAKLAALETVEGLEAAVAEIRREMQAVRDEAARTRQQP